MSTTIVRLDDVSKRFVIRKDKSMKDRLLHLGRSNRHKDDFWAVRDVSLDIASGSTVGLVGPNGSGKSTLLKMIGGIVQPTTGSIALRGRLAALLELGAGFHPDLTGRENVYLNAAILGISREQTDRYFDAIVDFSGIEPFIDTQVKFYSSGMYVRLAFSVAVHVDPDILLVDEVLAVGDEPFQRKCMDRIRGFQREGRTIILVSHSLDQVADLCDRAIVLEQGTIRADGEPRESLRVLRDDFEQMRREDVARANRASGATPPGAVRIPRIELSTGGPPARQVTMATGGDLTVEVQVESDVPVDGWNVGIGIRTPLGQVVLATDATMLGQRLPDLERTVTAQFTLPNLALAAGDYSVGAAVSLDSLTEAASVDDGAHLVVTSPGNTVGQIYVEPRLTVA